MELREIQTLSVHLDFKRAVSRFMLRIINLEIALVIDVDEAQLPRRLFGDSSRCVTNSGQSVTLTARWSRQLAEQLVLLRLIILLADQILLTQALELGKSILDPCPVAAGRGAALRRAAPAVRGAPPNPSTTSEPEHLP